MLPCNTSPSILTHKQYKMAKTTPFHSTPPSTSVYHDNTSCTEGNNIEARYRKSGTGGRPKCSHCSRL